jgi:hypothetical protein
MIIAFIVHLQKVTKSCFDAIIRRMLCCLDMGRMDKSFQFSPSLNNVCFCLIHKLSLFIMNVFENHICLFLSRLSKHETPRLYQIKTAKCLVIY